MIFNEPIDKHKDFTVVVKSVKYLDQRKLSLKFREMYFEGFQQKSLSQLTTEFDPLNLSEETWSFLEQLKKESMEGPQPKVTE